MHDQEHKGPPEGKQETLGIKHTAETESVETVRQHGEFLFR